jgi:hypothetical protein
MEALTIPETQVFVDDEHVIVDWEAPDGRRRATFGVVEDAEGEEWSVFMRMSAVDGVTRELGDATFEDVPTGVRWVVSHAAPPPAKNGEGDGPDHGRGVA